MPPIVNLTAYNKKPLPFIDRGRECVYPDRLFGFEIGAVSAFMCEGIVRLQDTNVLIKQGAIFLDIEVAMFTSVLHFISSIYLNTILRHVIRKN